MGKELIIALIVSYSKLYGVSPEVAVSVAAVESRFEVQATSHKGAIGIFQLMPQYFPKYTKAQLRNPEINIKLGIQRLAEYQKTCVHKDDLTWLTCYNFGPRNARKVRYPNKFPYVRKVKEVMADNFGNDFEDYSKK